MFINGDLIMRWVPIILSSVAIGFLLAMLVVIVLVRKSRERNHPTKNKSNLTP